MKVAFESDLSLPPAFEAISLLIDGAKVCVDAIQYDEQTGVVAIPLQRIELVGFRRSFLGATKPVYGETTIQSSLKISCVERLERTVDEQLASACGSCFTILLGLKVEDHRLYLGSVEEDQGNILGQLMITVRSYNIELRDEPGCSS